MLLLLMLKRCSCCADVDVAAASLDTNYIETFK